MEAEYGAFGEPTDPRVLAARLDEGLEVLAGLWSGRSFSHAGAHYRVDRATFVPPPLQQPRIPVWTACGWPNRRLLERAARWDGVLVTRPGAGGLLEPLTPRDVAEIAAEVQAGRSSAAPYDVAVINPGLPSAREAIAYAEAGATWYLIAGWLDELTAMIEAGPPGRPG